MSWNRMIFIFLLVASAAHAQEAKCPAYHGKVPLGYVGVNDGPPDHFSTELLPDFSSGEGNQEHGYYDVGFIFDNGHNLYLECIYGALDSKDRQIIKVEKKVNRCSYHAYPQGQPVNLVCK
jgi:hypothetical protein